MPRTRLIGLTVITLGVLAAMVATATAAKGGPAAKAPVTIEEQFLKDLRQKVCNASDPQVAAWDVEYGAATADVFHGVLAVVQTPEAQRKVADFLVALQRQGELRTDVGGDPPKDTAATAKTRALLAQKIDVDFAKTPVPDVLAYLEENVSGLKFVMCPRHENWGFDPSWLKVDLQAKGKTVAEVLTAAMPAHWGNEADWDYRIRDGYIQVGPRWQLNWMQQMSFYRVWAKDGRPMGMQPPGYAATEGLVNLLKRLVGSYRDYRLAMWADEGGGAQIKPVADTLVVTQTHEGHAQVEAILAALVEKGALARGSGPAEKAKPEPPQVVAIRRMLEEPVDLDFGFPGQTSLPKVLKRLTELKPGLTFRVDDSVAKAGINLDSRLVYAKVKHAPVQDVLFFLLGTNLGDLIYDITPDGIVILPRAKQRNLPEVIYKVKMP